MKKKKEKVVPAERTKDVEFDYYSAQCDIALELFYDKLDKIIKKRYPELHKDYWDFVDIR